MNYIKKVAYTLICILSLSLSLNTSFALNTSTSQTITLEDAKQMALESSYDKKLKEFQKERLGVDKESIHTTINTIASNPLLTIPEKENRINPYIDSLESLRNAEKSIEDSGILQDVVIQYYVEVQYIGLLSMEKQLLVLEKNLGNYEKLLNIERLKRSLGLSNALELENVFLSYNQIKNSIEQLKLQKNTAYANFKKQIGLSIEADINLSEISPIANYHIPNFSLGLEYVLENGIEIINAKRDLERKQSLVRNIKERHPFGSNNPYKPAIDVEEAKLKLEETIRKTELNFKSAHNDLIEKKERLDYAIKELNVSEKTYRDEIIKFDLGTTSKISYESKLAQKEIKKIQKSQAELDFLKSVITYNLTKEGVILSIN